MMHFTLFIIGLLTLRVAGKTNFLFIIIDDLRPALGCYGDTNAYTPNIDKLAEKSVLFSHAYAQLALCAPSRNSLLTSRRPDTLQLYDFYSYWRETVGNFTTLPEHLKNNGYSTKSIGKIFHPGMSCNRSDDSPYSWSEKPFHPFTNRYKDTPVCKSGENSSLSKNLVCPVEVSAMPRGTLPDFETLNAAKKFIKNRSNESKPFFLAVGFQKPHIPLKYPQEYLKYHPLSKFKIANPYAWPKNVSTVAYNPWSDLRKRHDVENLLLKFPWEKIPVEFGEKIIQSYYAAVTYIDDLIGILLKQLRDYRLDENTAVVLTSDHGWSLGEHAEWAKYSNFEVALRVPLIISIPKKEPHVTVTNVGRSGFLHKISEKEEENEKILESIENRSKPFEQLIEVNKNLKKRSEKSINETEYIAQEKSRNVCNDATVELVDIFPTIAELAGYSIPICADSEEDENPMKTSQNTCSEGISLMPLIRASLEGKQSLPWKKGAFSQYPRPGLEPKLHPNSDKPRLRDITIMGYSLRTRRFRYTAWVNFSHRTKKPNWQSIVAEELYDHSVDSGENSNVAENSSYFDVKEEMSILLRRGWRKALPNYAGLEI